MALYTREGLITGVVIKLRTAWVYKRGAYIQRGLHTGFYGILHVTMAGDKDCQWR